MPRTLLLCFIHGFKGTDDTFRTFPNDLQKRVADKLPEHHVESIVYPKYETKGELRECCDAFLSWLKEKVMDVRKAHTEKPWPPHDRDVGVILVAHSMGGFVASDTLFLVLNERMANEQEKNPMFPLIQGILTFDTPYNGLARSMFVYGAFSNYQKVSSVFNVMTALSAAPSALSKTAFRRGASSLPAPRSSSPAWKSWQLIAVKTGTVGAIAAGGVAAYMHREQIMDGMRSMRNLNKESVKEGYQQGVDSLSQGLAYINRGNVGRSFEYLSDHFTFVGTLMKQQELGRRLERLASLKGIGTHDFYTSLGENGMWSGGYFVPERTFCAIPTKDDQAYHLFSRQVIQKTDDEIQAHMSMFIRDKNEEYEQMTEEASGYVVRWFNDDTELWDDPKFATPPPPEPIEGPVATTEEGKEIPKTDAIPKDAADEKKQDALAAAAAAGDGDEDQDDDSLIPDESPLDITAAAALVPLPDDDDGDEAVVAELAETADGDVSRNKSTYMRYLMGVAQQAGTGVRSYVPTRMPEMPSSPSFKSFIPRQMPQMPSMPSIPRPGSVNPFGSKKTQPQPQPQPQPESSSTASEQPQAGSSPSPDGDGASQGGLQASAEPAASAELRQDPQTQEQQQQHEPAVAAAK
ncbi:hypothetical protein F4778DRAFT_773141 [Xylariomycetidae sp. FL2044]|nr:hypothetical protein F4778DRAFT_773141 [Xylariomycetidae sp. FL2044]